MDEFMEGRTPAEQNNGMGIAGFILALLSLLLCWIPFLNWILWILGLVFSIIGVTKPKKGLAIAGLVLCGVSYFGYFGCGSGVWGCLERLHLTLRSCKGKTRRKQKDAQSRCGEVRIFLC